ncbi:hypothetical protein AURDEDRAFT_171547 [Auricularia subglabra TFB-10046 SS5]|nr:hypothetical protein AURDEDRAFT_171547 [Auricularia subglabra TFB-10046 SS5]
MDVDTRGLPASTWRKIVDDKYHMNKELAAWIETQSSRSSAGTSSTKRPDGDIRMTEATAPSQRESVQKRVSFLSRRLRDELAQQRTAGDPVIVPARYTRVPEPGEDLPVTSSRAAAEPGDWRDRSHLLDVFYEAHAHSMVLLDEAAFSVETSSPMRWDEYWDYESSRILLFNRVSRVRDEHSGHCEHEILLHDAGLSWHQSRDDKGGVCSASRAMWCASENIVTDDNGKLVKFAGSTPTYMSGQILVHTRDCSRDISDMGTVGATASQGEPSLRSHRTAPPPDPVYGYAPKLPNGHEISEFVIRHHVLPLSDLARAEVRAFLIWELEEAGFRFQLRRLDTHILKSMKIWTEEIQTQRDAIIQQCWGGSDGFVPSGMAIPVHTNPDQRERVASIYNFWKVVRAWPRVRDVPNLRRYTQHKGLSMEQLLEVENEVWKFYAQTFYDYFGILPTLPKLMPPNPFFNAES